MIAVAAEEWLSDRGVRHSLRVCKKHGLTEHAWHKQTYGWWECVKCKAAYAHWLNARPENKKKRAEYLARPEIKRARRERSKEYDARPENKKKQAKYKAQIISVGPYSTTVGLAIHWKRRYGLELEDVVRMYEEQKGMCFYGGEPLAWEDKHIDHEHGYPGCKQDVNGKDYGCPKESVRGLSCDIHNQLEGRFINNLVAIRKIAEVNGYILKEDGECQ